MAWAGERKGIDRVATFRIKLLRLPECGKHCSAGNFRAGVSQQRSSQFFCGHSRPRHHVALAVEGEKDASSRGPEAEVELRVGCCDDLARHNVPTGALKYKMVCLEVVGYEVRLLLLIVFAVAPNGCWFGFCLQGASEDHEQ
ncbi:hypothetical protein ABIA99_005817 [Bradyrhizobium sp. LB12.1]|uniref:hypothetical protein n=1 Tax=Bradyrhizobium sp. LB12.1 TaxID=3156327 RepID=UPI003395163D